MKEKKDCKIVQDLLPNYIEKLTEKETNEYIEEHLIICEDCKKIYDTMKINLDNSQEKNAERKINFYKKYNAKLKILKLLLSITISLILLIIIIMIGRKVIILNDLQNKNSKYADLNNFYFVKQFYYDDTITITEQYKKDNKIKIIDTSISEYGKEQVTYYIDGEIQNIYGERYDGSKSVCLNEKARESYGIYLVFYDQVRSFKDLFNLALDCRITNDKCNGKECYKVEWIKYNITEYIDKESGLALRLICDNSKLDTTSGNITDFKYKFNKVTDEEFIEPNISEYEIVK